jgi:hypothetical protein
MRSQKSWAGFSPFFASISSEKLRGFTWTSGRQRAEARPAAHLPNSLELEIFRRPRFFGTDSSPDFSREIVPKRPASVRLRYEFATFLRQLGYGPPAGLAGRFGAFFRGAGDRSCARINPVRGRKLPLVCASKNSGENSRFPEHKLIDGENLKSHGLWSLRRGTTSCSGQ